MKLSEVIKLSLDLQCALSVKGFNVGFFLPARRSFTPYMSDLLLNSEVCEMVIDFDHKLVLARLRRDKECIK